MVSSSQLLRALLVVCLLGTVHVSRRRRFKLKRFEVQPDRFRYANRFLVKILDDWNLRDYRKNKPQKNVSRGRVDEGRLQGVHGERTRFLVKILDDWYLRDYRKNKPQKIVSRGRVDERERFVVFTENDKAHRIIHPPPECVAYLQALPVHFDPKRLHYNGTDFWVRANASAKWKSIVLEGISDRRDRSLHGFDRFGRWYRMPNDSQLAAYLATLPKAPADCDNHRLEVADDGAWKVRVNGKLKDLDRCCNYSAEVEVSSDNGTTRWFVMQNIPTETRLYINGLPPYIWDPYGFALSDKQILTS